MSTKPCDHVWIYDNKSCCYRLRCKHCSRGTTAYHVKGRMPKPGDEVKLVGETIEVIKK
jgi:hypothetical protein